MIALEPQPQPLLKPKAKRFPMRKWMTLVAGFRCRNGGVLLCSDREEIEGDFFFSQGDRQFFVSRQLGQQRQDKACVVGPGLTNGEGGHPESAKEGGRDHR